MPWKLTFPDFDRVAQPIALNYFCENVRMNGLTVDEEWIGKRVEQALQLLSLIIKPKLN
jgi:hypothetical protein